MTRKEKSLTGIISILEYRTIQRDEEAGYTKLDNKGIHTVTLLSMVVEDKKEPVKIRFHGHIGSEYQNKMVNYTRIETDWSSNYSLKQSIEAVTADLPKVTSSYQVSKDRQNKRGISVKKRIRDATRRFTNR